MKWMSCSQDRNTGYGRVCGENCIEEIEIALVTCVRAPDTDFSGRRPPGANTYTLLYVYVNWQGLY